MSQQDSCQTTKEKTKGIKPTLSTRALTVSLRGDEKLVYPPLLQDPRFMSKSDVDRALRNRKLSTSGSKALKDSRLLKAMVDEGPTKVLPQRSYARNRPERWYLAQGHAMRLVHKLVPIPAERGILQTDAMNLVTEEVRGMDDVACTYYFCDLADTYIDDNSNALLVMRVWFCAMKLLMATRDAFETHYGREGTRHCTMFSMMSGFRGIPGHLTESGIQARANEKERDHRRHRPN